MSDLLAVQSGYKVEPSIRFSHLEAYIFVTSLLMQGTWSLLYCTCKITISIYFRYVMVVVQTIDD